MKDKSFIDQSGQNVNGSQTNISGGVWGPVFTGPVTGPVTIGPSAPPRRPPLQKPMRAQHFTGRKKELAALLAALKPGRVVTLCGPGGIGKTALALEAIWHLAPEKKPPKLFPDGIIFHSFYGNPRATLALEAIALAFYEDPRPSPAEAARRALSGRLALIVLDGVEAADDLDAVLSVAGTCGVLITSRRHNDAPADWRDLEPLPLDEAILLLEAWGGDCVSDDEFSSLKICEILGGLPLAIYLSGRYMAQRRQQAADYLDWLETEPMEALGQEGKRQHRSVSILMERSLVEVGELSRAALGVAGALALESFESWLIAVSLEIEPLQADRVLGELVDYGMLLRPGNSYHVTHALLHTYARERLPPTTKALKNLAEFYNAFTRKNGNLGPAGYDLLDRQRAHILSVQTACLAAGDWSSVRRLTWAIKDYLDLQGHWTDLGETLNAGIAAARSDGSRRDEGAFLGILGLNCSALGETHRAIDHYEMTLTIAREIKDRGVEGIALGSLGNAFAALGETRRAIDHYEKQLAIAREIKDRRGEGNALGGLGNAYASLGETRQAIDHYEKRLAIVREIGDKRGEANAQGGLGNAYADLGDACQAIDHYEKQLSIAREIGDKRGEGNALGGLANAYAVLGETHRAIDHSRKWLAIARDIGHRRGEGIALFNLSLYLDKIDKRAEAIECASASLKIFEEIESPHSEKVRRELAEWLDRS